MNIYTRILLIILLRVRAAVSVEFDSSDLLAAGDQALALDDTHQAIHYYQQGISAVQQQEISSLSIEISLYANLGTALSATHADEDAIQSYSNAIQAYHNQINDIVDQEHKLEAQQIAAQAAFFLGITLQDQGLARDAADAYDLALQLDPLHWASAANAGSLHHDVFADHRNALEYYNRAYSILTDPTLDPTDPPEDGNTVMGELQYRIGLCLSHSQQQKCAWIEDPTIEVDCHELSRQAFASAVDWNPHHEAARHMLATVTADATMKRASNNYIQELFDNYAQNFEHSLVDELQYTGFERLRKVHDRARPGTHRYARVLDGGCGTGLAGDQFRNISDYMIGVDLSQAIIDQAVVRRPHLYNDTISGDLVEELVTQRPLSLVIAADSLIYFGDLLLVLQAMKQGLEPGGYAAFTLENVSLDNERTLQTSKPDWRWQLTPSGRFAHRKEYVTETAENVGFDVVHYEALDGFRFEGGVAVRGHAFILQSNTKEEL